MLQDAAKIRRVVIACGFVDLRKGFCVSCSGKFEFLQPFIIKIELLSVNYTDCNKL